METKQAEPSVAVLEVDIRSILVPLDDSECAAAAFEMAFRIAQLHEAEVHLLHVMNRLEPAGGEAPATLDELRAQHEQTLLDLAKAHGPLPTPTTITVRPSLAVADVIVQETALHETDLVVLGTHGRRGLSHYLLGSIAEEVIRHVPCDVLTVRAGTVPPTGPPRRILVAVDFSEFSLKLVERGKALAAHCGAKLHLLHVIEPLPMPVSMTGALTLQDLMPDVDKHAQEHLARLLGPSDGVLHLEHGQAARTINDVAERERADLLLIATHGLSALERFFIGSVTQRVVRTAPCPVWVVHDADTLPS